MKIKLPRLQLIYRLLWYISPIIIVFTFVQAFLLPDDVEKLPSHWNIYGQIDGWSGRATVWALPILSVFIFLLMYFSLKLPAKFINLPFDIRGQVGVVMNKVRSMLSILNIIVLMELTYVQCAVVGKLELSGMVQIAFVLLIIGITSFYLVTILRIAKNIRHEDEAKRY